MSGLSSPLVDAIALAALKSVHTRTSALSPKSVIIDCIPRPSAAPVTTAWYSTSAVLSVREACVLDQCFTIVPLPIIMPPLVDFLSGPCAQSESTCTSTITPSCFHHPRSPQVSACLLQPFPASRVGFASFVHISCETHCTSDLSRLT